MKEYEAYPTPKINDSYLPKELSPTYQINTKSTYPTYPTYHITPYLLDTTWTIQSELLRSTKTVPHLRGTRSDH